MALWVLRALAHWLQGRLSQRGATAVIADLSGQVLRSVTALPPRQLATERDAAAVVITRGLDGLRPYFTSYLPALFLAGILTPAAVAVMALYDLQSAAIVLIALPLIPIFMVLIGLVTAERSAASLAAMTTLQSRLLDLVAGIPTLRALGRAAGSAQRIAELAAAHRRSAMATLRIAFLSALVLELLATLGVALVAVSVGLRLVFGEMTLSAGLTALLLAPEVFWPLRRVGVEFHAAQDGKTAADKAFGLIGDASVRPRRNADGDRGGRDDPRRRADRRYRTGPGDRADRTQRCRQKHCIAGDPRARRTGIGARSCRGRRRGRSRAPGVVAPGGLAGTPPGAGSRHRARQPRAVRPAADLDNACRAAGFDEVLDDLPDGLQTIVGRGGVGLSLGQRQRLGLARVLGSPAPVLLLDEPTAHLDAAMESRVLSAIVERARAGATVLVVGHREPVLAIGDRVVHLTVR